MAFGAPALTGELEINQATADSATRTIPITLGTRTNGLLVVTVMVRGATGITSITATWNGNAMTMDVAYNPSGAQRIVILDYPVGAGDATERNLVVTFTDINTSQAFQAHVSYGVWDGAAQTTPTDRTATNTSTGATCSVDVAPPAENDELFVCAVGGEHNTPAVAAESALQAYDGGAWFGASEYFVQGTAAAKTLSFTGGSPASDVFWIGAVTYKLASGGPTTYYQSIAGATSPAGGLARETRRALAGSSGPSGLLAKSLSRSLAGVTSPSGVTVQQTAKALAGFTSPSGVVAGLKIVLLSLVGATSPVGALAKSVSRALAGLTGPSGSVSHAVSRLLAGAMSPVGVVVRLLDRALGGSTTPASTVTASKVALHAVAGVTSPSGVLVRRVARNLGGSLAPTGSLVRLVAQGLGGLVTPVSVLTRGLLRTLVGAVTAVGSLLAQIVGLAEPEVVRFTVEITRRRAMTSEITRSKAVTIER